MCLMSMSDGSNDADDSSPYLLTAKNKIKVSRMALSLFFLLLQISSYIPSRFLSLPLLLSFRLTTAFPMPSSLLLRPTFVSSLTKSCPCISMFFVPLPLVQSPHEVQEIPRRPLLMDGTVHSLQDHSHDPLLGRNFAHGPCCTVSIKETCADESKKRKKKDGEECN
ncbi:MAG: hypothetical protein JOS17DRAFT_147147 [Linnemannia elongata]|nr:MAG: hypothetical protein JOS17DRAFT_147147 [Linnemannia elongata]